MKVYHIPVVPHKFDLIGFKFEVKFYRMFKSRIYAIERYDVENEVLTVRKKRPSDYVHIPLSEISHHIFRYLVYKYAASDVQVQIALRCPEIFNVEVEDNVSEEQVKSYKKDRYYFHCVRDDESTSSEKDEDDLTSSIMTEYALVPNPPNVDGEYFCNVNNGYIYTRNYIQIPDKNMVVIEYTPYVDESGRFCKLFDDKPSPVDRQPPPILH